MTACVVDIMLDLGQCAKTRTEQNNCQNSHFDLFAWYYKQKQHFICSYLQSNHPLFESILVVDHCGGNGGNHDQHCVEETFPQRL